MNFRKLFIVLSGLLVMGLPAVAGAYYLAHVAPQLDALAEAERALPPRCEWLEEQVHQALLANHSRETIQAAREDREKGIRLCANGAEEEGALALRTALQDLGTKSEI